MRKKIVLIDGHSILNRAFFGLPDLTNAEGLHTNAVYGFLNILFKVLEEEQPEYLTVAFDVHAPTFRHKMYDAYKGTRKPMAEELRQQVPLIKQVLEAMGIKIMEKEGYEADDILGTIATTAQEEGLEVSVISGDRDLLQLADEHIQIRIPKTKMTGTEIENYYAKDVVARYQVSPKEFIDVKALQGDTADNIPGVPGIGEKTATNLIVQYGSIENAYEHVEELKPPRASKNLKEFWQQAVLSKDLATIRTRADISYDLKEAKLGELYTQEAYALFQRLEFKNLLNRFDDSAKVVTKHECVLIQNKDEAAAILAKAKEATKDDLLAFYIVQEEQQVLGVAIAYAKDQMFFLQAQEVGQMSFFDDDARADALELLNQLKQVIASAAKVSAFHLKEAVKMMQLRYQPKYFDPEIAEYLCNPLKKSYPYEDIASQTGLGMLPTKNETLGKTSDAKALKEDTGHYMTYLGNLLYTTYACVSVYEEKLKKEKMQKLFEEMEMPLVFTLASMEKWGIKVKAEELKAYSQQLSEKIAVLEKEIYAIAGEEFNINSPKQLGVILFEKMQLPNAKKTKTGYSTAADVLEKLAKDYPVVSKVLDYRQLTKLKSTYADGLATCIASDGRIHTTFQQTVTATGRLSSTEPNLQNIPVRIELGRLIRKVFVPEDGYVFVDADYSQIELRVLAHMSGDENLIEAYKSAQDIHTATASKVFHIPMEEVTPQIRRNAKAVNFGIVYGISSFGLSQDLSITRQEAQEYIKQYFETYPKIKTFLDGLVEDAVNTRMAITMYGRKRPVPELSSGNYMQRQFGERIAMNSPIQGTAADIIKIAMIRVDQRLKKEKLQSRLLLQVHDELLIEAKQEELEQVKQILSEEMEHAAELSVKLEIDMHSGNNWYEAK
ncbi:DNA polymerase I [Eubacterium oxidoreducens]|uniref:DNA polymerase I n=1 Tax=Eubacterium oxidoreducens TaxID=1732 RepID=A0A1G6BHZ6_EUBOX|nr:DNA polymerase I [Eubacterium oxidoreducens]SDB20217.1 DNA polymerase I [Eubacterium oxidoreducens]